MTLNNIHPFRLLLIIPVLLCNLFHINYICWKGIEVQRNTINLTLCAKRMNLSFLYLKSHTFDLHGNLVKRKTFNARIFFTLNTPTNVWLYPILKHHCPILITNWSFRLFCLRAFIIRSISHFHIGITHLQPLQMLFKRQNVHSCARQGSVRQPIVWRPL